MGTPISRTGRPRTIQQIGKFGYTNDTDGSTASTQRIAGRPGDYSGAAAILEESLEPARVVGEMLGNGCGGVGGCRGAQTQPERAGRLFGAAQAVRETIRAPLSPADQPTTSAVLAALRTHLGEQGSPGPGDAGRSLSRPVT